MKKIITIILLLLSVKVSAQTGMLMKRYYVSGAMAIGKEKRAFADSSAWIDIGGDTTKKGVLFPKVLLDSISTSKRALFVYDLVDSVLYHFDGNERVRYMTYKDTSFISQMIASNIPDHSNFLINGGNAFGNVAEIGTNDNEHVDIITNDTARLRVTNDGNVLVGTTTNDGYSLKVSGAIHCDSLIKLDVSNPAYEDVNAISIKGDYHGITRMNLGVNNYGSYIEANTIDLKTGNPAGNSISIKGNPPSAGAVLFDGGAQMIDLKGGLLGDGWKLFAPRGIWSYQHTSFPFQPIEFTGAPNGSSSQGIKLNAYSYPNALQVFSPSGNIGIGNVTTDGGFRLDVSGTTRIGGMLDLKDRIHFDNIDEGISITTGSYANRSITIGGYNTANEDKNLKLGYDLEGSSNQFVVNIGYDNDASDANHYTTMAGTYNFIHSSDTYVQLFGSYNVVDFPGNGVSNGACIYGSSNNLNHRYSAIYGYNQSTTADNQLIFAQARQNGNVCGYNDVYFGTGPRSGQSTKIGSSVTINGSGAGDDVDKVGGSLRIAAGKSTGNATPADIIFATASATVSGSDLQALSNRWYIKGETGSLSNTLTPTAMLDISGAAGYDQLRMRTSYTPTSSTDTNGAVGDVAWDDDYIYIKTSVGWKRSTLSNF